MENEEQITQYIQNVLQREPMEGEVDAYVALVESGNSSLEDVQMNIINSAEAVDNVYPIVLTYQAIYGRVPDADGLDYWTDVYRANMDLDNPDTTTVDEALVEVLKTFVNAEQTPEFATNYGVDPTGDQFVAAAYTNVLNRAPDQAGLTYWQERYADIEASYAGSGMSEAEVDIAVRAQILEQFVESAEYKTATSEEVDAYLAMRADGEAIDTDMALWDLETPGVEGELFTLQSTSADSAVPDEVTGTANDDTIRAVVADSLESVDVIDGGDGDDVLNISAGAIDANNAPVIDNVERINNSDASNILDLADVTGAEQIWSRVDAAEYDNASLDTVFGIENIGAAGATVTVNLAASADLSGDNDSVTIALNNNDATLPVDLEIFESDGATAADDDIEVANLMTSGFGGDIDMTGYTGVETLNIDGTGTVEATVSGANAALTTIDASGNDNDVTVDASTVAVLETLTSGAGDDGLTIDGGVLTAAEVSVSAGAGADDVTMAVDNAGVADASAVSLSGGAGGDVFTLTNTAGTTGNLAAAADNDDLMANLVTITDFDASVDTLNITDFGVTEIARNQVQSAVDAANPDDLFDAATAAFGETSNASLSEEAVLFNFEGNAYIGVDVNDDGALSAGDGLISLTGVAVSDLDASTNFVA